jgi:hypothetical protein
VPLPEPGAPTTITRIGPPSCFAVDVAAAGDDAADDTGSTRRRWRVARCALARGAVVAALRMTQPTAPRPGRATARCSRTALGRTPTTAHRIMMFVTWDALRAAKRVRARQLYILWQYRCRPMPSYSFC